MAYQELLRSQKNEVFRTIEKMELSPSEFEWEKPSKSNDQVALGLSDLLYTKFPTLTHTPSGYYFNFGSASTSNPNQLDIRFFPNSNKYAATLVRTNGAWKNTLQTFESWLSLVLREHSEPDLWSSINANNLVAESLDKFENSAFTSEEQDRISKAIVELKVLLISDSQHSPEQAQFIEERLLHLEESSKRLGRKDWITLAMGTLTNIVVGAALAPDAARNLIRHAESLLGWIVSSTHLLP